MFRKPDGRSETSRRRSRLSSCAKWIDTKVRFFDLWLNRADGWRLFPRHSWSIAITGSIVLLAMTNGPILLRWRGALVWGVIAAALAGFCVAIHLAARPSGKPCWNGMLDGPLCWLPLGPWGLWLLWVLLHLVVGELPYYSEIGAGLLVIGVVFGLLGAAATPHGGPTIFGWMIFVLAAGAVWLVARKETTEFLGGVPYRQMIAPIATRRRPRYLRKQRTRMRSKRYSTSIHPVITIPNVLAAMWSVGILSGSFRTNQVILVCRVLPTYVETVAKIVMVRERPMWPRKMARKRLTTSS